jgi:hypothetical protein
MKATLEFNLDDSDDEMAYQRCIKSKDMAMALWEITHNTKKNLEYTLESTASKFESLEVIFDKIYEILRDNKIDIEQLIN